MRCIQGIVSSKTTLVKCKTNKNDKKQLFQKQNKITNKARSFITKRRKLIKYVNLFQQRKTGKTWATPTKKRLNGVYHKRRMAFFHAQWIPRVCPSRQNATLGESFPLIFLKSSTYTLPHRMSCTILLPTSFQDGCKEA